ncbi:MAG TPA: methylated-DNA--[protein]-cysteine S-methyltransferase [Minicystis sp.]|nr:methylated-DNA--[protein]-cysteine S-methyltransferase [Minicystis sp.]
MNASERLFLDSLDTPIGRFALVADTDGRLRFAGFETNHARMERELGVGPRPALVEASNPSGLTRALARYFEGELGAIDGLPVAPAGTPFQLSVWRTLLEIPSGAVWSYADVARRIGNPAAVRAVGLANGANPIAVVVPCHRVIGANGTLTGYGGGLDRKRWLLAHENALPEPQLSLPA